VQSGKEDSNHEAKLQLIMKCMLISASYHQLPQPLVYHNIKHVRHVLQKMQSKGLKLNQAKCSFFVSKIEWLGYIISEEGIEVDKSKIEANLDWPVPQNTTDILSYLGFTGWYRKFIEKYSHVAAPMTELLKKNAEFKWTDAQQAAFETTHRANCTSLATSLATSCRSLATSCQGFQMATHRVTKAQASLFSMRAKSLQIALGSAGWADFS